MREWQSRGALREERRVQNRGRGTVREQGMHAESSPEPSGVARTLRGAWVSRRGWGLARGSGAPGGSGGSAGGAGRELCWGVWGLSAMRGEGSHKEMGAQRRGMGSESGGFVRRLGVLREQRLEEGTGAQGRDQRLNGGQRLWEADRAV